MSGVADAAAALQERESSEQNLDRQTGADPDPDSTADPDDLPPAAAVEEQEPQSLAGRLAQPLEGSIREDRVGELYDPERGGLNRLVLVVEEVFGFGDGLPRAVHVPIALAEMAEQPPEALADLTSEEESSQTAPRGGDTQEILEHSNT